MQLGKLIDGVCLELKSKQDEYRLDMEFWDAELELWIGLWCYMSITMSTWLPSLIITTIITPIWDANSCLSPLHSLRHFPEPLPSHSRGHTTSDVLALAWGQKPGQAGPSQARPDLWPEMGFGLAWSIRKPKPSQSWWPRPWVLYPWNLT